jgi:hypothetical protein
MTIPDGAKTISSRSVAVMLDRDGGGSGQELCAFETSAGTVDAACETWNKLPPDIITSIGRRQGAASIRGKSRWYKHSWRIVQISFEQIRHMRTLGIAVSAA